jgi:hypothetical protein
MFSFRGNFLFLVLFLTLRMHPQEFLTLVHHADQAAEDDFFGLF